MRFLVRLMSAMMIALLAMPVQSALPDSFSSVVEPVMPAVVNISTTQKIQTPGLAPFAFEGLPDDPQFRQFNDLFREFNRQFGNQMGRPREVTSLGSGFVIDTQGYVVTNNHVIAQADEVSVVFADDTRAPAKIVGRDPKTDLALLKITTEKKLTAVQFGDSDALKVGDWVIAVGNPFGLGGSVSAGIVSARGRNIHAGPFDDFIQTDAAINRGNSGGPLFNTKGEVVGINAAIFSPTGGNIGIGFAVPSNMAKPVIEQLRKQGKVQRAWLGVKIQDITEEIADSLGLSEIKGALVLEVDGPATKSGILPGDVIVKFNGELVRQNNTLPRIVANAPIGKKVDVVVWRNGKEHTYSVKLGELPSEKQQRAALGVPGGANAPDARGEVALGMALAPITSELKRQADLPRDARGLLVTNVDPSGEAARRGIQPGDMILDVNQQPVDSVKALKSALADAASAKRNFALLHVQRRNLQLFIAVPAR